MPDNPQTVPIPLPSDVTAVPVLLPVQGEKKLPSVTTAEQDRTTASQRDTSMMWEKNQKWISLLVIGVSTAVAGVLAVCGRMLGAESLQLPSAMYLFGSASLVIGFYFGRTNHTQVGGSGETAGKHR